MNRKPTRALLFSLILIVLLSAVALAEPGANLSVVNIDGTWSNPSPAGVAATNCYALENSPGDETNENKIHAGSVNSSPSQCYTDVGFSEGSGFGFDGKNGPLNVAPTTPFLIGVLTHYNRRISSNSGLDGARLDIKTTIGGAAPAAPTFQYNIVLDESPNNPDSNDGNTCPYPTGSFYGAEYLAFNGGYDNSTAYPNTYGTPFTHPNVGGSPPSGERGSQWLCGDGITATLATGTQQQFTIGGDTYTLILLGVSYPASAAAGAPAAADDLELCSTYPGSSGTSLVFETKELEETPGCIWAQFAAPTAVGLSTPPRAATPAAAPAALLALLLLAITALGLRARAG